MSRHVVSLFTPPPVSDKPRGGPWSCRHQVPSKSWECLLQRDSRVDLFIAIYPQTKPASDEDCPRPHRELVAASGLKFASGPSPHTTGRWGGGRGVRRLLTAGLPPGVGCEGRSQCLPSATARSPPIPQMSVRGPVTAVAPAFPRETHGRQENSAQTFGHQDRDSGHPDDPKVDIRHLGSGAWSGARPLWQVVGRLPRAVLSLTGLSPWSKAGSRKAASDPSVPVSLLGPGTHRSKQPRSHGGRNR